MDVHTDYAFDRRFRRFVISMPLSKLTLSARDSAPNCRSARRRKTSAAPGQILREKNLLDADSFVIHDCLTLAQ